MRRVFYILAGLGAFLLLLFFFGSNNISPAMKVNGRYIKTGDYYGRLSGFEYYNKLISSKGFDEDAVRKGVIMSLIIDELIELEFETRGVEKNEADKKVEAVLDEQAGDIEKAALEFYGWSTEEFKKFVLMPQARRDILAEVLRKDGLDFNDWLRENLTKADIKIYSLPYRWGDGQLVDK